MRSGNILKYRKQRRGFQFRTCFDLRRFVVGNQILDENFVLCNKLRLLDIILKHLGFSPSVPAVVAETPVSKMCPRDNVGVERAAANGALWTHTLLYTTRNA